MQSETNNLGLQEQIKNISLDFLGKLDVVVDSIEIEKQESNIYNIKIKSPDSPIIIGHSWETLRDLKNILSMILNKNLEEKVFIHIEINDYIESKDKRLFEFVKSKIDFCEKSGKEIILPFFSAYERKKIHSYVSELKNDKIIIKSAWEGKERRMHISKKEIRLTIDLNWNDI